MYIFLLLLVLRGFSFILWIRGINLSAHMSAGRHMYVCVSTVVFLFLFCVRTRYFHVMHNGSDHQMLDNHYYFILFPSFWRFWQYDPGLTTIRLLTISSNRILCVFCFLLLPYTIFVSIAHSNAWPSECVRVCRIKGKNDVQLNKREIHHWQCLHHILPPPHH